MQDLLFQGLFDRVFAFVLAFIAAAFAGVLTFIFVYLIIIYFRLKKREKTSLETITVEIRLPKDNEIKIDAAEQMFTSLSSLKKSGIMSFLDIEDVVGFEIVGKKAEIKFYASAPAKIMDLVEKTIYGYYPNADIKRVDEPNIFSEEGKVEYVALVQKAESDPEKATFKTDSKTLERIDDKASKSGFETTVRIVVSSKTKDMAKSHLKNIKSVFSQFNSDLNNLTSAKIFFKGGFMLNFIYKFFPVFKNPLFKNISIFSSDELATLFHFPNKSVETPHLKWLKAKTAPVASEVSQDKGMYVGQGYYRGVRRPVYLDKLLTQQGLFLL